jgi:hypothetical protein
LPILKILKNNTTSTYLRLMYFFLFFSPCLPLAQYISFWEKKKNQWCPYTLWLMLCEFLACNGHLHDRTQSEYGQHQDVFEHHGTHCSDWQKYKKGKKNTSIDYELTTYYWELGQFVISKNHLGIMVNFIILHQVFCFINNKCIWKKITFPLKT